MIDSLRFKYNALQNDKVRFTSNPVLGTNLAMPNVGSASKLDNSNLLYQYMVKQATINTASAYMLSEPIYTPALEGIDNVTVRDLQGNVVQNVEFKKDGNKITEEIFVKSVNGSTVNKTIVNDGENKSMEIVFKNRDGKILGKECRSYKKIDNDNAVSTHNGKLYKITGLSGDLITVESDGKKVVIDLSQKIQDTLDNFDGSPSGKVITQEQRDFLANSVKKLSGDLILKFDEEIDKLCLLDFDDYEGFYRNDNGVRKLQLSAKVTDDMTFLHELGHAICSLDNQGYNNDARWCDNKNYRAVRAVEMQNFNNRCNNDLTKRLMNKFMYFDYARKGYASFEDAQKDASDEEFAEITGFLNCMDVVKMNERTPALLQFMPTSTQMVYEQNRALI